VVLVCGKRVYDVKIAIRRLIIVVVCHLLNPKCCDFKRSVIHSISSTAAKTVQFMGIGGCGGSQELLLWPLWGMAEYWLSTG